MSITIQSYIDSIQSENATIPAVMQEETFLSMLSQYLKQPFETLDDIKNYENYSIFFYGIEEGKKEFSITTVKKIIEDTALKPYFGKNIFILENFDTANLSAQNATLKLIEDCPSYAVIILLVSHPKGLIPTILSRVIVFSMQNQQTFLDTKTEELLEKFNKGDRIPWIEHLYSAEYSETEASQILTKVFSSLNSSQQEKCKFFLTSLFTTNEKTKTILEAFFLGEDFFS